MRIVYSYDDGFHDDFNVSEELKSLKKSKTSCKRGLLRKKTVSLHHVKV